MTMSVDLVAQVRLAGLNDRTSLGPLILKVCIESVKSPESMINRGGMVIIQPGTRPARNEILTMSVISVSGGRDRPIPQES